MANPEVDRLIQELSQILNTNREKRSTSEAMVQGMQQGQQQAAARRAAEAQPKYTPEGYDRSHPEQASTGSSPGKTPAASQLSPSTTRDGRIGIAQRYAYGQSGAKPSDGQVVLEDNAAPYEFLSESDVASPAMSPADAAILEERKKRMTQTMMLSRGQSGGPLGGAGAAPQDPNAGLDPAVVDAVSRSGGPVAPMRGGAAPAPAMAPPPQGWSPDDYAKLNALSQRYPG